MALDTYANLKTELASWLARSDLTSQVDTFIDLFEAWANRNFRVRQMENEATTAAAEYIELPADFLELRDIQYQGSPRVQLQYVTPEFADLYDTSGASGTPKYYTLVGDQLRLVPAPDTSSDVRISYWQSITPLSVSDTTNWLLTEYPDAYLYGSLMHARAFLTDNGVAAFVQQGWGAIVEEIRSAGRKSNLGGALQIRPA